MAKRRARKRPPKAIGGKLAKELLKRTPSKKRRGKTVVSKTLDYIKLRKFRSQISKLKKAGLVPKGTDARKAKPTAALLRKVKAAKPVLAGKAKAFQVARKDLAFYKERGDTVIGNKVLLATQRLTKRQATRLGMKQTRKLENGKIERVELPVRYKKLDKFLKEAKGRKEFETMKDRNERWAFKLRGHKSIATFEDLDQLLEYFERYKIVEDDPEEAFEGLEIVRVSRSVVRKGWKDDRPKRKPRKYGPKEAAKDAARKRRKRTPKTDKNREDDRKYQAGKRAKLKASGGAAYRKYLAKESARHKRKR